MKKNLQRLSLLCLLAMVGMLAQAQTVTATWDFADATIMESTMAFRNFRGW